MPRRWDHLDARIPEVLAILKGLDAESELAARMALAGISVKCRSDRAWKRRTEELRAAVIHSTGDLLRVVEKARAFEAEVRAALDEGASDLG